MTLRLCSLDQQGSDEVGNYQAGLDASLQYGFRFAHACEPPYRFVNPREGNNDNAFLIADCQIPSRDGDPAEYDRQARGTGSVARRRVRRESCGEAWEPERRDALAIPNAAVSDEGHRPGIPGHAEQIVAGDRRTPISVGSGHDHIARLGQCQRREDRQVIVRSTTAGKGYAHEVGLFGHHRLDLRGKRATTA